MCILKAMHNFSLTQHSTIRTHARTHARTHTHTHTHTSREEERDCAVALLENEPFGTTCHHVLTKRSGMTIRAAVTSLFSSSSPHLFFSSSFSSTLIEPSWLTGHQKTVICLSAFFLFFVFALISFCFCFVCFYLSFKYLLFHFVRFGLILSISPSHLLSLSLSLSPPPPPPELSSNINYAEQ